MSVTAAYPVHVDATLDPNLSRWLWLVKWVLAIPHYIVLAGLWAAFVVTSVYAFFAILVTGRYPPSLFTFNVGVLRWSWRVTYYAYGALGTDRYPPFSLHDDPDFPAHLSVEYPAHLSRGLVLVKWWLLALPHYVIVGILVGGGTWSSTRFRGNGMWFLQSGGGGGLIGVLVLVAGVILAVTGAYPSGLYDVVLGLNRWTLRVAGYAGLMTDVYPPFHLDRGGSDPATLALTGSASAPDTVQEPAGRPAALPPAHGGWSSGRVVALVCGSLASLLAIGMMVGGVALAAIDHVSRDSAGYLTTSTVSLSNGSTAITSDAVTLEPTGPGNVGLSAVVGTVRIRVTPRDPSRASFIGIGPSAAVTAYLAGTAYATVRTIDSTSATYTEHAGSNHPTAPAAQSFWTASGTGTGTQVLSWTPVAGDWSVVVMNADAQPGVDVNVDAAATAPGLSAIAWGVALAGALLLLVGVLLVVLPIRAAARDHHAQLPSMERSIG